MADSRLGIYSRNRMFVDDGTVTVNGARLGDMGWYLTTAPEVDALSFDTSYTTVTGAHGSRDLSLTDGSGLAYAGRRTVTLHLRTVGTWQEAVKSKVALGSIVGGVRSPAISSAGSNRPTQARSGRAACSPTTKST